MQPTRIQKLDNNSFLRLAIRNYFSIDRLMRLHCEGGLQYGWDFPTFAVLFTRKWKRSNRIKNEGRRRFGTSLKVDNDVWNKELETFTTLRKKLDRRIKRKQHELQTA
jgi:hypothetical protein